MKNKLDKLRTELKGLINEVPPTMKNEGKNTAKKEFHKNQDNLPNLVKQGGPNETKNATHQKEEQKKYNLNSVELINDYNNEKVELSNLSLYERAKKIAQANGESISLNDPVIETIFKQYYDYNNNKIIGFPPKVQQSLEKQFGNNWKNQILNSYKEGFQTQITLELTNAHKEGINLRNIEIAKKSQSPNPFLESNIIK